MEGSGRRKGWNWFRRKDQGRDHGEPALLAGMVRRVIREHDLDAGRVFVAGLSAGGAMAAVLGRTHPDLFTAVGVHSGLAAGAATNPGRHTTGRRAATRSVVRDRNPLAYLSSRSAKRDGMRIHFRSNCACTSADGAWR